MFFDPPTPKAALTGTLLSLTFFLILCLGEAFGSEIRLLNGDGLRFETLRYHKGQLWVSPVWGSELLEIPAKFVDVVLLPAPKTEVPQAPQALPDSRVFLSDGDFFEANLLDLNEAHARFQMSWGQSATVKRDRISKIEFRQADSFLIFQDDGDPSDWRIPQLSNLNQSPVLSKGNVYTVGARAALTRSLPPLPEKFLFEFFAHASDPVSNFHIGLVQGEEASMPRINFIFANRQLQMQVREDGGNIFRDNWSVEMPLDTEELRVMLWVNASTSEFKLEINDVHIRSWQNENLDLSPGVDQLAIRILYQYGQAPLKVGRFRVLDWDGRFLQHPPQAREIKENKDRLLLQNGDTLNGGILSISPSHVQIEGNERIISIGRDRVRSVYFSENKVVSRRKQARDVQLEDAYGHFRMTLALHQLDDGVLAGESDSWEELLRLPREYLGVIRFNPYVRHRIEASDPLQNLDL